MPTAEKPILLHIGSLITFKVDPSVDQETCLGYLWIAKEKDGQLKGIFDANLGAIDITVAQAEEHNRLFDEAVVKGLNTCEVGQCGLFYYGDDGGRCTIKTWMGTLIADRVERTRGPGGRRIFTFTRDGKKFQGVPSHGGNDIVCKRIS
jgi:hypothetical protein